MEPPPAATVWISIIGARMRTPATSVSNARSYSPSKWATSVDVPPMSKPMTREKPASRPVSANATTPPAGPERMASLPAKRSAAVRPPDDIMNISRAPDAGSGIGLVHAEFVRHLRNVARQDRREIGVHDRRVAAPDQLDERAHLVADRHLGKADLARQQRNLPLMRQESGRRA